MEQNKKLPIFIGGEGRSGTSLMRVVLNSHSNIAAGPESQLFRDPKFVEMFDYLLSTYNGRILEYTDDPNRYLANSFQAMINAFFEPYMLQNNKKRWAEKSPHNIMVIDFLVNIYNRNLKFIHMIRDGRDVVSSILSMDWGPENITDAATRWNDIITSSYKHRGEDYYLEIKYEDLVNSPEEIVKKVCEFIEEDFEPEMLQFHKKKQHLGAQESSNSQIVKPIYKGSMGRWNDDLTQEQIDIFMDIAGQTLSDLGYE